MNVQAESDQTRAALIDGAAYVIDAKQQRGTMPRWWGPTQSRALRVVRDGHRHTIALTVLNDGRLAVGVATRHPEDRDNPEMAARAAVGRMLGEEGGERRANGSGAEEQP